jgi:hypothetical protein
MRSGPPHGGLAAIWGLAGALTIWMPPRTAPMRQDVRLNRQLPLSRLVSYAEFRLTLCL